MILSTLSVLLIAVPGKVDSRPHVRLGLEVLLTDSLDLVRGRRIGLVTNHAAVDRSGIHLVQRLRSAGLNLVALFSPEHGFRGAAKPGEVVASSTDSATGLPIYSLYGATSAPTESMSRGIDVMIVDLPDVGARYFTYLWTTTEVMRSAKRFGQRVIVLDRPNPIGADVQGNVLDPKVRSAVGLLAVPMRHGLTLGELARLANHDLGIGADLVVAPVAGWRRRADALDLGLDFVPPSPNLRSWESLFHYPGTCLFEGTALSVGRGTDEAYRQIGAPWLDTTLVLAAVRRARISGVEFEGVAFTPVNPGDGKYDGVRLSGIRLRLTDRKRYDPTATAVRLLAAIREAHPDQLGFVNAHFDRLAGGPKLRQALSAGEHPGRIVAGWKAERRAYLARRKPFVIYR